MKFVTLSLAVLAVGAFACGDDDAAQRVWTIAFEGLPATAAGGTVITGAVHVVDQDDGAVTGDVLDIGVAGGGHIDPIALTLDDDGRATFTWTLGPLPIDNLIAAADDQTSANAVVTVGPAAPLTTATFGDVETFLADSEGSTEDLAFAPDGKLVMAHGGAGAGLFTVDATGKSTAIATSGVALSNPLGLAYDDDTLYIADGGNKALMMFADGVIAKVADKDGDEAFASPNDVAVGAAIFMSDTCTGKLYAIGRDGGILDRVVFSGATDGGPNGVAVDRHGDVWMTTENTGLFCGDGSDPTAAVASLFRIPFADGRFGTPEKVASGLGAFGDGLAFDATDNLYAIFDTVDGFALKESIVYVRRAAGGDLVRAFGATGKVYANLAFGRDGYGATTMYLAMLKIALVQGSPRGLERVEVGVSGE